MTPDSLRDFRAVYRGHHGFVWHALHRFGVDSAAIEDAVQDVFVVAYRRREEVLRRSTKAWLYGIARRVASNYRRSDRRRVQRVRSVHVHERRAGVRDAHESIHALDAYLSSLDEGDREIFLLSELEGMTGPEIAQACGRNVNTVYTRIGKLRRELHDRLGDLERAKGERPRATAQRWAAILPLLRAPAGASVVLGKTVIAVAFGALAASSVLAVADRVLPEEPEAVAATTVAVAVPPKERDPAPRRASTPRVDPPTVAQAPEPTQASVLRPAAKREPRPTPAQPRIDDLAAQNELLARAASALKDRRGSEALQITNDHAQRFPKSPLADLRAALRIEALCILDKPAQARAEARLFLEHQAASPVARRISRSCGAPSRKPTDPDTPGS